MPAKKMNRINCLDRALSILETAAQAREIGVSELARRLNLHVATTFNLVKTLTLRNYLVNINGRYRPGPALESLSASWDARLPLPQLLDPFVQELSQITGENAVATILSGFQAKIIISCEGHQEVSANFRQTICNPLFLATGQVLVAFGPEVLWKQFAARYKPQEAMRVNGQKIDNDKWIGVFKSIRAAGLAEIRRSGQIAIAAVAAPVLDANNRIVAALGASCPEPRFTGKHISLIKKQVIRSAKEASKLFGGKCSQGDKQ
jgi:DNA-binding IclR family transcriptional regulator